MAISAPHAACCRNSGRLTRNRRATYTSPFGRTAMCRVAPAPGWNTVATKPSGTVIGGSGSSAAPPGTATTLATPATINPRH